MVFVNYRRVMRKKLLASLIVCVALLTQIGASFWGAAAAREGFAPCHRQIAVSLADHADGKSPPSGGPVSHDHASCSLCQLGLTAIGAAAPVLPARSIGPQWRMSPSPADAPPPLARFNKSAAARAPPSPV